MKNDQAVPAEVRLLKSAQRGRADHGWLQASYSFSFASYHDPARMGFGPLRVLNQDHIRGGGGFPTHGHENMEIITWVQAGELEHVDSLGNRGRLGAGELQVMSAGSGVRHSEANASESEGLDLMQMWVLPRKLRIQPRWEQRRSPIEERQGRFAQLVGPHEEARAELLTIDQDARLFAALLASGQATELELPAARGGYVHVARGAVRLGELALSAGDGAELLAGQAPTTLTFEGLSTDEPADLILWQLPV